MPEYLTELTFPEIDRRLRKLGLNPYEFGVEDGFAKIEYTIKAANGSNLHTFTLTTGRTTEQVRRTTEFFVELHTYTPLDESARLMLEHYLKLRNYVEPGHAPTEEPAKSI